MTLKDQEAKAVVKLLKSLDDKTLPLLEEQLKSFDFPTLRQIKDQIPENDLDLHKQFSRIALNIKREELLEEFQQWSCEKEQDLEKGIFLIGCFANPFLDRQNYSGIILNWTELINKNLQKIKLKNDPTSIINEINHFLFMELRFKGNTENYYDPENSFIDKVLEKRLGNPILLSIIYLLISKKLNLPLFGVNMPAHFLVKYEDGYSPIFIDPFNKGEIVTKTDCLERVKTLKLLWHDEYLSTPTNKQIIVRIIQNLISIYHNKEQFDLKKYLESYLSVLKNKL